MDDRFYSKQPERMLRQKMFVRVCSDSGFTMSSTEAAQFAAMALGDHPMLILAALGIENMERIASGEHPVCATLTPAASRDL